MSLRQRAANALKWTFVRSLGGEFSSFLVFLVLARLLAPDDFGLAAYAATVVAFLKVFVDQGFARAIVQRDELEPEHVDTAFWTNLGVAGGLMAAVSLAAEPISRVTRVESLAEILPISSLALLFGALSLVQQSLLQRELQFRPLAIRTMIANLAGGIFGLVLAFRGFGVWALVGQQVGTAFVAMLVLWTATSWRPRLRFSRRHFRDLFSFGISLTGTQILRFFGARSDRLLIGSLLGTTELGIYVIALNAVRFASNFLARSVSQVGLPAFSRAQKDPARVLRGLYFATRAATLIAIPAFVGIAVVAPLGVTALFGTKWEASVPVLQILAAHGIGISMVSMNGPLLLAMGRPTWVLGLAAVNAGVAVTAIWLAAPWGIAAVAAAVSARTLLMYPLGLTLVHRLVAFGPRKLLGAFLLPVVASLAMGLAALAAIRTLPEAWPELARLAVVIGGGGAIYLAFVWIAGRERLIELADLAMLAVPALRRNAGSGTGEAS